jgi:cell division protein ZapA (FtsZ GTPase activity inhibitor)
MEESIKTTVKIAGRVYPIFVSKTEETEIKDLERKINTVFNDMQMQYALTDKLDCLAMTMLHLLTNKENTAVDSSQKEADLSHVIELIEASLEKKLRS